VSLQGRRTMFAARTLRNSHSQWSKNKRKDASWACFWTLIMSMPNKCPAGDCSMRPDQPQKMPGFRVVALFWVRPDHHEQRNEAPADRSVFAPTTSRSRSAHALRPPTWKTNGVSWIVYQNGGIYSCVGCITMVVSGHWWREERKRRVPAPLLSAKSNFAATLGIYGVETPKIIQ